MTITRIQAKTGVHGTGLSLPVNLDNTPQRYNTLIAAISSYNTSGVDASVSSIQQLGIDWGLLQKNQSTDKRYNVEIWMGIADSGGGPLSSLTINLNSTPTGGGVTAEVFEYSGVSSQLDYLNQTQPVAAMNLSSGVSSTPNTGGMTTKNNTNLWVAAAIMVGSSQNSSTLSQFTLYDGAISNGFSFAYLEGISPGVGAFNPGTNASSSGTWYGCDVSLLTSNLTFQTASIFGPGPGYNNVQIGQEINNVVVDNILTLKGHQNSYIDIYSTPGMGQGNAMLTVSQSIFAHNDIGTYGSLTTLSDPIKQKGGGAVAIGHGWEDTWDYPRIELPDAGFNTLYITAGSNYDYNYNPPKYLGPRISNIMLGSLFVGSSDSCSRQENMLKYSQDFSQTSVWGPYCGNTSNVTFNNQVDPNGTNTATKIVMPATLNCNSAGCWGFYQTSSPGLSAGKVYTASIWLKGAAGNEKVRLGFNDSNTIDVTLTSGWQRFIYTYTPTDTSRGFQFLGLTASSTFYCWGAQLEQETFAGLYTPTTNSTMIDRLTLKSGSGVTAILNSAGGLGTLDTSILFSDFINSATGSGGITFLDKVFATSTYPFKTQNNTLDDGSGNQTISRAITLGGGLLFASPVSSWSTGIEIAVNSGYQLQFQSGNSGWNFYNVQTASSVASIDGSGHMQVNGLLQIMAGNNIYANGTSGFNGNIGDGSATSGQSWGGVWANYLGYHTQYNRYFDQIDDLAYVKNYKVKKIVAEHPITHVKEEITAIDIPASFPFLVDKNGFMTVNDHFSYTMGCLKQSALKHDEHEADIANILTRVEAIENQLKQKQIAS
jgi:hypothetical protein